jgi:hypothetical protein
VIEVTEVIEVSGVESAVPFGGRSSEERKHHGPRRRDFKEADEDEDSHLERTKLIHLRQQLFKIRHLDEFILPERKRTRNNNQVTIEWLLLVIIFRAEFTENV